MPQLCQPTSHTTHIQPLLRAHGFNALLDLAIALKIVNHQIGAVKNTKMMIGYISINQSNNQSTKVIHIYQNNTTIHPLTLPPPLPHLFRRNRVIRSPIKRIHALMTKTEMPRPISIGIHPSTPVFGTTIRLSVKEEEEIDHDHVPLPVVE